MKKNSTLIGHAVLALLSIALGAGYDLDAISGTEAELRETCEDQEGTYTEF